MKYAVIQLGGAQHNVSPGQKLQISKLEGKVGDTFETKALLLVDGDKVEVGTPELANTVSYKIIAQKRLRKIDVFTYKGKSRYRKHRSIRPLSTEIEITNIA